MSETQTDCAHNTPGLGLWPVACVSAGPASKPRPARNVPQASQYVSFNINIS
jgi:hypothetical protein